MKRTLIFSLALPSILVLGVRIAPAADSYTFDPGHTAVTFKISHLGMSWTYGDFNKAGGSFTIDGAKSNFDMNVDAESIDTGNDKRDTHLRSPDFLNTKQFPAVTFKSTAVKPLKDGLEVSGDFTLHGVTRPIKLVLNGGKTAEFPAGVQRTGYSTELSIKRSDFGMDKMLEAIGDEVKIAISFEGVAKK